MPTDVASAHTSQVKDDASAYQLDLVFDNMLDKAAEVEGCAGAARLVCKTEWDYKLIIKFEDVDSLKGYMTDHHDGVMAEFLPQIKELAVGGEVHQQNFVCESPPPANHPIHAQTKEISPCVLSTYVHLALVCTQMMISSRSRSCHCIHFTTGHGYWESLFTYHGHYQPVRYLS